MFKIFIGTSIEECILFSGMAMKVTVREDSSFMMHAFNELFGIEHRRVEKSVWLDPFPIEINT